MRNTISALVLSAIAVVGVVLIADAQSYKPTGYAAKTSSFPPSKCDDGNVIEYQASTRGFICATASGGSITLAPDGGLVETDGGAIAIDPNPVFQTPNILAGLKYNGALVIGPSGDAGVNIAASTINGAVPGAAFDTIISATFSGGNFGQSNDVTFSSLGANTLILCDVTGQRSGTITGFSSSGVKNGQTITLLRNDVDNGESFSLPADSTASSAGNRIYNQQNSGIQWYAQGSLRFYYSTTTAHWQLLQNF